MVVPRPQEPGWGIQGLGWGPGWAIGGWFIPLANLVIPKLVVDTVWSGGLPPTEHVARRSSNALIWSWWLCLLVGNVTSNMAARKQFTRDDTAAEIVGYNTPSTVLMLIAAILAMVLVRRITRMQEQRQAALDQPWQQMVFPAAPPSGPRGEAIPGTYNRQLRRLTPARLPGELRAMSTPRPRPTRRR